MQIAMIGSGYVGLVTGACFSEFGHRVTCVDKDPDKIEQLSHGKIPIYEPGLEEIVRRGMQSGLLHFSGAVDEAIVDAQVIFIAVGTPPRVDGAANLDFVDEVARTIARNLSGYKIVVTKSTVPVGTGDRIRTIIERELPRQRRAAAPEPAKVEELPGFDIVSNPEFLREGNAVEDFLRPERIIIGASSERAVAILKDLYGPLYLGGKTRFVVTDVRTAELIKYATNAFLATKITFINEIANLCDRVGSNVQVIATALGMDSRISPRFLNPGPGFGGSCFPKDTKALFRIAEEAGYHFGVVEAVIKVNERQQRMMVDKIKKAVGGLERKTIGLLGLAFKPNTDDVRGSAAITIARGLKRRGAVVRAYDPAARETARPELSGVAIVDDLESAARGADALVIVTEWNQFRHLDFARLKQLMKRPLLIDLRNIYIPAHVHAAGFEYVGVGQR